MKIDVKISAKTNKMLILSNINEAESKCIIEYSGIETKQARIWKGEIAGEWQTVIDGTIKEDITDYIITAGDKTCTLETNTKLEAKTFYAERKFSKTENLFLRQSEEKFVLCAAARNTTEEIARKIYPIGSVYISVNAVNPAELFGGTWAAFGKGRALVGVDTSQTEFNSAEKQGGEKTHTLTTKELASHNHGSVNLKGLVQFRDINLSDSNLVLSASGIVSKSYPNWSGSHAALTLASKANYKYNRLDINATHEHSSAGGGAAHNNLQPYITVYMWKRTA